MCLLLYFFPLKELPHITQPDAANMSRQQTAWRAPRPFGAGAGGGDEGAAGGPFPRLAGAHVGLKMVTNGGGGRAERGLHRGAPGGALS